MRLLGRMGDAGLFVPPLAVLLGLALPPLAHAGEVVLVPCVALLLAMSIGLAEPGRLLLREIPPVLLIVLTNLLLTPLAVLLLAKGFGVPLAGGWLVLVAACPAAGGAALVASLLGLPVRPLLLAQLLCFAALPVTAPLVAALLLEGVTIAPGALFLRVLLMVALPALAGLLLRQALGRARRLEHARSLRGLGVLALAGIGLAVAAGLTRLELAPGQWSDALLGLSVASAAGAVIGWVAARRQPELARGFALAGAVRNVSLLWSATLGLSPPEGQLVMMLGTLWTLLLPALLGLRQGPMLRAGAFIMLCLLL